MKKTRNLFTLVGKPADISCVIEELQFKGLIAFPLGTVVTPEKVEVVFNNNKSVVCSANDYSGELPMNAIQINVEKHNLRDQFDERNIIFLSDQPVAEQFSKITEELNFDIGDHKSNSSGLNGSPTIKDCAYCKYLAGDVGINERVLYRSERFFVIPTLGQFIKGYLLIIPFKHVMSNAELNAESIKEFQLVLEDVEYILKLTYHSPSVLVWENGSGKSGIGKAKDSIVHSHVHVAPSNLNSRVIETVSGFPFETISLEELSMYREHSYLLIRSPDYNHWKINNNPELYIPRQYVRQLLAEEYNILGELWNWRKYPFKDKMHQTAADVKLALQENWHTLPKRIQNNTAFLF